MYNKRALFNFFRCHPLTALPFVTALVYVLATLLRLSSSDAALATPFAEHTAQAARLTFGIDEVGNV